MIKRTAIKKKTCKHEGCPKYSPIGLSGWCWEHLPEELRIKVGSKAKLARKNKNKRVAISKKLHDLKKAENNELELWFLARRQQMVGYCSECSGKTFRDDDKKYKWSIAHICFKSLVPSVATNYYNWLELCWQCHSDFDSRFDKAKSMKCFHEAKTKFELFRHLIPNEELRKVNPYLLNN